MLRGASEPAKCLVESFQPYHVTDPWHHPLAMLARLSNVDKHRHLLVGATWVMAAGRVHFPASDFRTCEPAFMFEDRWSVGADLDAPAQRCLQVALNEADIPMARSVVQLLGEGWSSFAMKCSRNLSHSFKRPR
jgi:hypothetical protein